MRKASRKPKYDFQICSCDTFFPCRAIPRQQSVLFSVKDHSRVRASAPPLISIIDDDASVRAATNNLVRSFGYRVCMFASAEAFLESRQLDDTACVITDVQMPVMSGLELQLHLRAKGSRLPFIFMTGFPEESVRARAMKDGAICFLAKPFDGGALSACLNAAVGRPAGELDKCG